jgi:hypothetical protein
MKVIKNIGFGLRREEGACGPLRGHAFEVDRNIEFDKDNEYIRFNKNNENIGFAPNNENIRLNEGN